LLYEQLKLIVLNKLTGIIESEFIFNKANNLYWNNLFKMDFGKTYCVDKKNLYLLDKKDDKAELIKINLETLKQDKIDITEILLSLTVDTNWDDKPYFMTSNCIVSTDKEQDNNFIVISYIGSYGFAIINNQLENIELINEKSKFKHWRAIAVGNCIIRMPFMADTPEDLNSIRDNSFMGKMFLGVTGFTRKCSIFNSRGKLLSKVDVNKTLILKEYEYKNYSGNSTISGDIKCYEIKDND